MKLQIGNSNWLWKKSVKGNICFIVGVIHSLINRSFFILRTKVRRLFPKSSNFDSSVNKTCFHFVFDHVTCFLAKLNLFMIFLALSKGLRHATRPSMPQEWRERLITDWLTGTFLLELKSSVKTDKVARRFLTEHNFK